MRFFLRGEFFECFAVARFFFHAGELGVHKVLRKLIDGVVDIDFFRFGGSHNG